MILRNKLKKIIKYIRIELHAMALAFTYPKTPWYVKLLLVLLFLYAASPIDLIPDFIPVLGMIDDIAIISLGLMIASRLIPKRILEECRQKAKDVQGEFSIKGFYSKLFKNKKK